MPATSHTVAEVSWESGDTPRSIQFDDPYYSIEDGRAETRHVFIGGNRLPERWSAIGASSPRNFTIAELGFGTGLNFLETLYQWSNRSAPVARSITGSIISDTPANQAHLTFVSFECHPLSATDMARALAQWPALHTEAERLLKNWPPAADAVIHSIEFPAATLKIHLGDANETVPAWTGTADAWYLDGFSPAKNSALWNADLMASVYAHTAPNGTFSTYTVAGFVRRNLIAAGFEIARIKGYGRKRESLAGHRPI